MTDAPRRNPVPDDHRDDKDVPAGLAVKDPTDTDHPTGAQQAQENAATESAS